MNPRVRRLLAIFISGAVLSRLFVLGQERGFGLVARATTSVTLSSIAAWLVHLALHELAHWVAARAQDFEVRSVRFGPLALDLTGPRLRLGLGNDLGGGVNALPRGAVHLRRRVRLVAAAGPLMTAAVTLSAWLLFRARNEPSLASPWGIFLVMGGFTLVTALLPGALLPRAPPSGTDLEQLLLPRAVLAHWLNASALQGVSKGRRLSEALDWRAAEPLLPEGGGEVEALEVAWAIAALEAGEVARGEARLRSMVARLDADSPEWQRTDVSNQLGCLSALGGDVVHARACLAEVRLTQSQPWYCELLAACIARAESDPAGEGAALEAWWAGVEASSAKAFAVGGNRWILERLQPSAPAGSAR